MSSALRKTLVLAVLRSRILVCGRTLVYELRSLRHLTSIQQVRGHEIKAIFDST